MKMFSKDSFSCFDLIASVVLSIVAGFVLNQFASDGMATWVVLVIIVVFSITAGIAIVAIDYKFDKECN